MIAASGAATKRILSVATVRTAEFNSAVSLPGSFGWGIARGGCRPLCCSSKHDTGFHLNRLPIPQVRLELPLIQGIGDSLRLLWKCAEKVNVFDLALFVDDDPDRNRVEPAFGAQSMELNSEEPLEIELELTVVPFKTTEPVGGGARVRMKLANAEASSRPPAAVAWPGLFVSSG